MGLQILTALWGEKHVNLFERAALKSLTWPANLDTLRGLEAKWNIFADDEHHSRIAKMIPTGIHFHIRSTKTLRDYIDQVQSATLWQMNECIKNQDKLLLAPPDTIFGDGTIHNLWKLGRDKHSCVVIPHPRVLPSFLDALTEDDDFDNESLVTLAFEHLHKSWSDAEVGHALQNSFVGGVSWTRLQGSKMDSLYSVVHRLPTVYLADFTEEDLNYFKSAGSFGHFDHKWPGDILVPRGRQRFCGSSDACFAVEVTEAEKNVPPIFDQAPVEGFWKNDVHNQHNAQITAIFRGN